MNGEYRPMDTVLDGWQLQRQIGAGSYGKVFEAIHQDSTFGKTYHAAMKIITVTADAETVDGWNEAGVADYTRSVVDEMLREIDLMYRLKGHTNIVSYEGHAIVPHDDGVGWDIIIRMELLIPLRQFMKQNPLTQRELIRMGMDICKALELCQKYNIVHRDIKPENIFVSQQGDFKLGDFGVARTMERTHANMSKKGTYTYMAPEVYQGKPYGPTADIYSLGMVLYRLLNYNRVPFLPPYPQPVTVNDQEQALLRRMRGEPLPVPANARGRMAEIIFKACAWDPMDRYSAPWLLRAALQKILYPRQDAQLVYPDGDQISYHSTDGNQLPDNWHAQPEKPKKKRKLWLIPVIAVVLMALAAGSFLLIRMGNQAKAQEQYNRYLKEASRDYDDPEEALETLEKAMELLPQLPEAYAQYAYVLYLNGQYEESLDFAQSGVVNSQQLELVAASAAFELGEYRQAADYYYVAAEEDPDVLEIEHLRDYAVCLGRLGRLDEAAAVFVMLTDRGSSADVTDYVLGETYYAKEQYDLAAECFHKVLDTTRDDTLTRRCWISLAETCRNMGDSQALAETCQEGLAVLPGNTVLLEMLGSAYYQLAQQSGDVQGYLEAAACFQRVIDGGVAKDYLYVNVVTSYTAAKAYDKAYDAAEEMADMYPRDYTPYAMMATVLILMENEKEADARDYSQAYEFYEQAKELVTKEDDQTQLQQLEGFIGQLEDGGWLD